MAFLKVQKGLQLIVLSLCSETSNFKKYENEFTVGGLTPGTTYYFSLMGYVSGNGNPYYSGPVNLISP